MLDDFETMKADERRKSYNYYRAKDLIKIKKNLEERMKKATNNQKKNKYKADIDYILYDVLTTDSPWDPNKLVYYNDRSRSPFKR